MEEQHSNALGEVAELLETHEPVQTEPRPCLSHLSLLLTRFPYSLFGARS